MTPLRSRLKVTYVIDHLGTGGAQRQLVELLRSISKSDFDVAVISLSKEKVSYLASLQDAGIPVILIGHKGKWSWKTLRALYKRFRASKPDIVHTWLFTADLYGRLAAFFAGVPHVLSALRSTIDDMPWRQRAISKILSYITERITINTECARRELARTLKIPTDKIRIIYNGIDLLKFPLAPQNGRRLTEWNIPRQSRIVAMVARMSYPKDYRTFLEAAQKSVHEVPDAYFVLIGDGPMRRDIEQWIKELGLADCTRIIGACGDVYKFLNHVDLCVLATHYEGCSNVILEAMASAKPVVATNVGGNGELISDGETGYLVPSKNPTALAEAIVQVLRNREKSRQIGMNGRKRVEAHFTLDRMVAQTEALYREVSRSVPMKVAFIVSKFPCYDEAFILRELFALSQKTDLVIYSLKKSKDPVVHDEARELLAKTVYAPYFFSWSVLAANLGMLATRPFRYLRAFFGLIGGNWKSPEFLVKNLIFFPKSVCIAAKLEKDQTRHVHAYWATYPASVALTITRLTGIPYSFTGHAHDIYLDTTDLDRKMSGAKFVSTCTRQNKNYLATVAPRYPSERIRVNYHGLDLQKFSVNPVRNGISQACSSSPQKISEAAKLQKASQQSPISNGVNGKKRNDVFEILSVGTLQPHKGFDYLLQALALLKKKDLSFHATIIGGGSLESELREQLKRLKLEPMVTMTGALKQSEVIPYYKKADILVLVAQSEWHWGIPNVLIEALAAKAAVITTRFGSVEELVQDGQTGILVPGKDSTTLASAIEKMYRDDIFRQQLANAGHRLVTQYFDINKNIQDFVRGLKSEYAATVID